MSNEHIESVIQSLQTLAAECSLLKAGELSPSCQKLFERLELGQLLVVEGIHVLSNKQLYDLCDIKVCVTLDHSTCKQRREHRHGKLLYLDMIAIYY